MLQIVLADFKERTRRYSYLITLGFVLFFGYLVNTGKYAIKLGVYRGEYNSAWVGSLMAMGATTMLLFAGFFLINNSIKRDYKTGVGQILATTTLTNFQYLLGKFFSHILTLSTMVFFLVLSAIIMQLFGQSNTSFDFWVLISPFIFTTIPAIILVASLAVFFESIKFLNGNLGNVIYFITAEGILMAGFFSKNIFLDISGFSSYLPSMEAAAKAAYPNAKLGLSMGFVGFVEKESKDISIFLWEGIDWTQELIISKFIWIIIAIIIIFISTFFFKRFDQSYEKLKKTKKSPPSSKKPGIIAKNALNIKFKDLTPVKIKFSFLNMLIAEIRLRIKGYHWVWYIIWTALIILQLFLPVKLVTSIILPLALIWPITIWSSLGTIEKKYNTDQIIKISPSVKSSIFPVSWGAGFIIALISGSGLIIRSMLMLDFSLLTGLINAIIFIPTLALFLGILSGNKKLFEIIYMILWYLGPINSMKTFNYICISEPLSKSMFLIYISLSVSMFLIILLIQRKKQ